MFEMALQAFRARWSLLNHEPLTAGGTQLRPTYAVHSLGDGGHTIIAPSTDGVLLNRGVGGSLGGLVRLILFCVHILEAFPGVKYRKVKPGTIQYQFSI